jgi:phosphoenolpyruvate---glycerone phosphotransferase subunit DhaL
VSHSWASVLGSIRLAVEQAREELGRLDAAAGDGDLGLTMVAAATAAAELADRGELDGKPAGEALRSLGMAIARSAPSTAGTLLARGLLQASRDAGDQIDDQPVAVAAALVRAGIGGIQKAGKAQPGERTMLDALVPLADALDNSALRGDGLAAATASAAVAARAGADSTAQMEAKIGRASWIPERAKGNVDGGAHAVAVMAAAIADVFR